MKNTTIALPERYVAGLAKLQQLGMIPSRSEGIRLAIRDGLRKDAKFFEALSLEALAALGKNTEEAISDP